MMRRSRVLSHRVTAMTVAFLASVQCAPGVLIGGVSFMEVIRDPASLRCFVNTQLAQGQAYEEELFSVSESEFKGPDFTRRLILLFDWNSEWFTLVKHSCYFLRLFSTDPEWQVVCDEVLPTGIKSVNSILKSMAIKGVSVAVFVAFREFVEMNNEDQQDDTDVLVKQNSDGTCPGSGEEIEGRQLEHTAGDEMDSEVDELKAELKGVNRPLSADDHQEGGELRFNPSLVGRKSDDWELYSATVTLSLSLKLFGRLVADAATRVEGNRLQGLLDQAQIALESELRKVDPVKQVIVESINTLRKVRQDYASLAGFESYSQILRLGTALQLFEHLKGRNELKAADKALDPISRFLIASYDRVIADGLSANFALTYQELLQGSSVPGGEFRPAATLRVALTGLILVVKSVLNFDLEVDSENSLPWSESSTVLRVSRNGDLYGRIFIEFLGPVQEPSMMRPARCRTRTSGPAIVLLNIPSSSGIKQVVSRAGNSPQSQARQVKNADSSLNSENGVNEPPQRGGESLFERYVVSERYVHHLFHETAHALHCVSSEVDLHLSGISSSPVDFQELPSHLFECMAQEWLSFVLSEPELRLQIPELDVEGAPLKVDQVDHLGVRADTVTPAHKFKAILFASVFVHCLNSGSGEGPAELLNERYGVTQETYAAAFALIAAHSQYAYSYVIASVVGRMVFYHGDYSRKLRSLFQSFRDEGFLAGRGAELSSQLIDSTAVEPMVNEDGIREFFSLGAKENSFRSFFAVVPGLEERFDTAVYFEESVDFEPIIEELRLASETRDHTFVASKAGLFSISEIRDPGGVRVYARALVADFRSSLEERILALSTPGQTTLDGAIDLILSLSSLIGKTHTLKQVCGFLQAVAVSDARWSRACEESLLVLKSEPEFMSERQSAILGALRYIENWITESSLEDDRHDYDRQVITLRVAGSDDVSELRVAEVHRAIGTVRVELGLHPALNGGTTVVPNERADLDGCLERAEIAFVSALSSTVESHALHSEGSESYSKRLQTLQTVRQQYASLCGFASFSDYLGESSALHAFELLRGRTQGYDVNGVAKSKLDQISSDPVVRFLRTAYSKVLVEGLGETLAIASDRDFHEINERLQSAEADAGGSIGDQTRRIPLRDALLGLLVVVKGVLSFDVEDYWGEPKWSDSFSLVLVVSRGGVLYGKIYVDLTGSSTAQGTVKTASDMFPVRCRAETNGPGIALIRMSSKGIQRCTEPSMPVARLDECESALLIDSFVVSEEYTRSLFYEIGLALGCIGSEGYLQLSGVSDGPKDLQSVAGYLFAYMAREWMTFLLNERRGPLEDGETSADGHTLRFLRSPDEPLEMPEPVITVDEFKARLFASILVQCLNLGAGSCEPTTVLGELHDESSIGTLRAAVPFIANDTKFVYGHAIAMILAPMVFHHSGYARKLQDTFQASRSPENGLIDLNSVEPMANEEGIRAFFAAGSSVSYEMIFAIAGLGERWEFAQWFEDAFDFDPIIEELKQESA